MCRELSAGYSEGLGVKSAGERGGGYGGETPKRLGRGLDVGKEFHWAHVLDASGRELLSYRVENDEADISKLIDEALLFAEEIVWALDQPGGGAALLLALLWERDQGVLYVPGLVRGSGPRRLPRRVQNRCPRCAHIIAYQARMRGRTSVSLRQLRKSSPNCSFSSLAAATSSPTRAEPSLASERRFSVAVSRFRAGAGSERQRSPYLTHSLPNSHAA
jgi:hypothetical protein